MLKTALCDRIAVLHCFPSAALIPRRPVRESLQQFRFLTKTCLPARQALLVMKLTILFLLAGLLNVQAKSYSQTMTFNGKNVSLTKVFKAIESQTGYTVFANKELLKDVKSVSIAVKNMPLNDFLATILIDQPIGFEIHSRTIFITAKTNTVSPTAKPPTPDKVPGVIPPVPISGRVLGADGLPLEGATIAIKGNLVSATTNSGGHYSFSKLDTGKIILIIS